MINITKAMMTIEILNELRTEFRDKGKMLIIYRLFMEPKKNLTQGCKVSIGSFGDIIYEDSEKGYYYEGYVPNFPDLEWVNFGFEKEGKCILPEILQELFRQVLARRTTKTVLYNQSIDKQLYRIV